MKKMATLITLFLFSALCVHAQSADIQGAMDELIYTEIRIAAVTVDMYMYLGWMPEEKDLMRDNSKQAILDLDAIRTDLINLETPPEITKIKEMDLQIIDKLKAIYDGVEKKKPEEIKKEFLFFIDLYLKYQGELETSIDKYGPATKLPDDFNAVSEEFKLIKDRQDAKTYAAVMFFLEGKNYKSAYRELAKLQKIYKGTAFEHCIMLRMSDCLLIVDSNLKADKNKFNADQKGISFLSKIVNDDKYSPVLYEAFYRWRTSYQYFGHGMSNMSFIPNIKYNEKRWDIIQRIKKHLVSNPGDIWAKAQIDLLISMPNITRGGTMGNHNLEHWGELYTDIKSKENKK